MIDFIFYNDIFFAITNKYINMLILYSYLYLFKFKIRQIDSLKK